jgi:hypothetical protein
MYGRLTIIDGDPGRLDQLPEPQEATIPRPNEMPGLLALYCLIDRETGRGASLSIWDSREAMEASEDRAGEQRVQAVEAGSGNVVSVERMEVVNAITQPHA